MVTKRVTATVKVSFEIPVTIDLIDCDETSSAKIKKEAISFFNDTVKGDNTDYVMAQLHGFSDNRVAGDGYNIDIEDTLQLKFTNVDVM